MTQRELVDALSSSAGVTPVEAERFLSSLSASVTAELKAGRAVAVPELGIFELVARKERAGRHPKTGAALKIPAQTSLHFRPAAGLKRLVNP